MCTLAIFRDVSVRYPIVVAANRDEFLARPTAPPARLSELPNVVAGRDLQASGTWLGCRVGDRFLVAGLLNRRASEGRSGSPPGDRSRGLLCVDSLRFERVDDVVASLSDVEASRYGPFNLLVADTERAVVVDNGSGLRTTDLDTGLSVLTNLDVNDPRCPRLASAVPRFETVAAELAAGLALDDLVTELAAVLSNHEGSLDPSGDDPFARVCIHGEAYGTRSASIIVFERGTGVHYFHADGPPCRAVFARVEP